MGPLAGVLSAVSGVVGAVGAIQSARAQRESVQLQQRQQEVATRRSRLQAIRQAQISRARAVSAGAAYGGLFGSGVAGGVSSLGSQLGSELGFSSQMSGLSRDIAAAQARATKWGAISNLGFTAFNALGGFDNFNFGGRNQPTSPQAAGHGHTRGGALNPVPGLTQQPVPPSFTPRAMPSNRRPPHRPYNPVLIGPH